MKRLITIWLLILSLVAMAYVAAKAQDVILPVYDAAVGEQALKQIALVPNGRKTTFIVNPNSGPGAFRDAEFFRFISGANAAKQNVIFYIDVVAWPGDGLVPKGGKKRLKTPQELLKERQLYSKWYGELKFDGWFFDDVSSDAKDALLAISNWPGIKVLNPGCAWMPPATLSDALVVISEQKGAWPRPLTAWEKNNKSKCIVMGLEIANSALPVFMQTTAGMAMRYASPLDDEWKQGKSAYTQLTPHYNQLRK